MEMHIKQQKVNKMSFGFFQRGKNVILGIESGTE